MGDEKFLKLPLINSKIELKWLTLIIMVFQNTLLVLLMRYSRVSSDKLYITSTAVVMSEFFKFLFSVAGIVTQEELSVSRIIPTLKKYIITADTAKLAVPGLLYTIQNNLLFVALSNLEAAVYQVSYQLKILTTAIFSVTLLSRRLGGLQVISLLVLFLGVSFVQIGQLPSTETTSEEDGKNGFIGLICVLLACCSSGFAGVYMEKIFKSNSKVSLYIRNLQLSVFGTLIGLVLVLLRNGSDVLNDGFFQNYNTVTWMVIFVQAGSGFVIASVMKYADNILKGFATAVSIILSSVLSIYIFDFTISFQFFTGASLVVLSVFLYGYKPKQKSDRLIHLQKGRLP